MSARSGPGATLAYPGGGSTCCLPRIAVLDDVLLFDRHPQWTRKADTPGTVGPARGSGTRRGPYLHASRGISRTLWALPVRERPGDVCPRHRWVSSAWTVRRDRAGDVTINPASSSAADVTIRIERCSRSSRSEPAASRYGDPTGSGPPPGQRPGSLPVTGLPLNGAYHWQVRADDGAEGRRPWGQFGSIPMTRWRSISGRAARKRRPPPRRPAQAVERRAVAGGGWFSDEDGVP